MDSLSIAIALEKDVDIPIDRARLIILAGFSGRGAVVATNRAKYYMAEKNLNIDKFDLRIISITDGVSGSNEIFKWLISEGFDNKNASLLVRQIGTELRKIMMNFRDCRNEPSA